MWGGSGGRMWLWGLGRWVIVRLDVRGCFGWGG